MHTGVDTVTIALEVWTLQGAQTKQDVCVCVLSLCVWRGDGREERCLGDTPDAREHFGTQAGTGPQALNPTSLLSFNADVTEKQINHFLQHTNKEAVHEYFWQHGLPFKKKEKMKLKKQTTLSPPM